MLLFCFFVLGNDVSVIPRCIVFLVLEYETCGFGSGVFRVTVGVLAISASPLRYDRKQKVFD